MGALGESSPLLHTDQDMMLVSGVAGFCVGLWLVVEYSG